MAIARVLVLLSGFQTVVSASSCGIRNIDCMEGDGAAYYGKVSKTHSGLECQAWNVQTPHKHRFGRLGDHNHCRNPDGEPGPWCYTTSEKRFELCTVRRCTPCDKGSSVKTCGKDEYKVKLEVRTRFRQKSVVKAYTYTEKIRSSKTFKKKLEEMSTSASVSGSYGAFSASASAAYSSLTDSVESNEDNAKDVRIDETTFNKDFLQIFQEVVTTVSIDGKTATKTKTEFVNSVPVTEPWSSKKLRDEANSYMEYEFPEGAKRNVFAETVCRKRLEKKKECPNRDWRMYKGSCYAYYPYAKKTWADAEAFCRTEPGAHLASIHSAEELIFVQSNFPRYIWFGASDIRREGTFEWSDGSSWNYSAWKPGEPNNNGNQDCLVGNAKDHKWDDDHCEEKKMFLCKKRLDN